ncbi:MAG: response regulator [Acidobacteria bacterium]|nr:response regulator [Acidobacteriota bacterium]
MSAIDKHCRSEKDWMTRVALVVDDSMLIRHTVCRFLEDRGYTVETATNGLEALDLLESLRPCLIVTDLQMPKMTGVELIAALRSRSSTASIPIVVLTGSRAQQTAETFPHVVCKDIDIEAELGRTLDQVSAGEVLPG